MLENSLKFHFELQNFLKEFSVIFPNYLAFKSFLNNFLDFKNNSEKRNFYSNPVRPTTFGPQANLLLPVSSGPTGPASLPDDRLLPHVKVIAELHSAPPPRRAAMAATPSPLLMAYHYHSLILAIIAIYNLYSLHAPFIPAVGHYRGQRLNAPSPDPINRPPHPRRSPHLPHITLPPLF
jgi:hypothetical protein